MFGGLAQLVERLLCKQDVSGSSPLTSIQRELPGSEDKGVAAVVTEVLMQRRATGQTCVT